MATQCYTAEALSQLLADLPDARVDHFEKVLYSWSTELYGVARSATAKPFDWLAVVRRAEQQPGLQSAESPRSAAGAPAAACTSSVPDETGG